VPAVEPWTSSTARTEKADLLLGGPPLCEELGVAAPRFEAMGDEIPALVLHFSVTPMPTKYPRIAVTQDEELSAALERVAAVVSDAPTATVVHDLAVKGAEALLAEHKAEETALERLIAFSTERRPLVDWDVLEHVEELAWGE